MEKKEIHPSSLIPHPSHLVPWYQRKLPLRSYVFLIVVEVFFEVCCWVVGEFFLFWLSFGLLKSKVQKMNQTPLRLRLVACFGLALIVLFAFFVGRCAFGEETQRIEAGAPGAIKGVAIAAPHESYDSGTAVIAKRIAADLGLGWVVAHGYRSDPKKVYINVNRPTENLYEAGKRDESETETPRARAVYEEYQAKVFAAARVARGPLKLYIEIHGHARRAKIGAQREIVEVTELATAGYTADEFQPLKAAWDRDIARVKADERVPMFVDILDPIYEYEGKQVKFYWNAAPAKRLGIFRPECVSNGLHFEMPPSARRGAGKDAFIAGAEAMLREALKRL